MRQKIWALISAALLGVGLALIWSGTSGFTDYSPGVQTIMGASVCTGSPTTDALLVYGGSTWCGSTVNNAPLISGTASSLTIESAAGNGAYVTVEPDGTTSGFAIGGSSNGAFFVYDNAGGTTAMQYAPSGDVLDVAPIGWNRGADLTQTNESRTPLTLYDALTSGTYTTVPGKYTPSVNMHIRSLEVTLRSTLTSCTTYPTYDITLVGSAQATDAVTLTANNSHWITNSGALAVPAGDAVSIVAETAGVSCSPSANNATFVMEMTTD